MMIGDVVTVELKEGRGYLITDAVVDSECNIGYWAVTAEGEHIVITEGPGPDFIVEEVNC